MTSHDLLVVVALLQGAVLAGFVVLILLTRGLRLRRSLRLRPRRLAVDAAMRGWAAGAAPLADVLVGLRRLPAPLAIEAVVDWSTRIPGERWGEIAAALQDQGWTRFVRAGHASARWWRRLECARFLSVVPTASDVSRLVRLINDPHPAVHIAAVVALERIEDATVTLAALERLPRLPLTVQAYYAAMLRRSRPVVVQYLLQRLRRTDDPALARLAEFAGKLAEPALREQLTALADHAAVEVRIQSARALGSFPHRESITALSRLIGDGAWEVRAQAARALGMIVDPTTLSLVHAALRDPVWWVRLRAALALARFAGPGRNALLAAEVGAHAAARDMAKLVLGLPPQALAEFAT